VGDVMHMYISGYPEYKFGFSLNPPTVEEKPCPHPDGHLWERQNYQLLSNPPQNVYCCVREGCGVVRHVLQHRPKRVLIPDHKLPK